MLWGLCQALRQPPYPGGKISLLCLYVLCISSENRKKLRLSIIIFRLQFRLKSSCVRLNQMTLPAIRRKRRTSFNRQAATLDPSTRKTCWRETWGLALLRLSPGRPEAAGVTSNPGLSACAAPRLRPAPPTANRVTGQGI